MLKVSNFSVEAFEHFCSEYYHDCLKVCLKSLSSGKDFYCYILGILCLINKKDFDSAKKFFLEVENIDKQNFYVRFIKAYLFLIEDNIEAAINIWLEIINSNVYEEKEYAKNILENTKHNFPLEENAKNGIFLGLIPIPNITQIYKEQNQENTIRKNISEIQKLQNQFLDKEKKKPNKKRKLIPILLFCTLLLIVSFFAIIFNFHHFTKDNNMITMNNIVIDPNSIQIEKTLKTKQYLYQYNSKKKIINDIKQAKQLIIEKKVNQARFLLQKILNSNVNFLMQEKMKLLLDFIPVLSIDEFDDFVSIENFVKNPILYKNIQALWNVDIISYKKRKNGTQFVLHNKQESGIYKIKGFLNETKKERKWFSYKNYFQKNKKNPKEAVIFGIARFLYTVEKKKNRKSKEIYFDIHKIWY